MGGSEKLNSSGGSNKSGRCNSSSKKRRRRISTSSSDEDSQIDQKTEEGLQQAAKRHLLSSMEVKSILKKVCTNDHVLALVKLKEEELERIEKSPQKMPTTEPDDENPFKLTRAKARALNKPLSKIQPLKIVSSDISALIEQELASDEDDDEYQPGDEDPPSDDDLNTTASDLDSQPRTPRYASSIDGEHVVNLTPDGLFKIPRYRTESVNSAVTVENYTIAQQTRSKVSLESTPIEKIETSLASFEDEAPYTDDQLFDHNYLEFLQDIFNPPAVSDEQQNTSIIDEDDEDDEDFHLASTKVLTACREEMSSAPIPKKEYEDLLSELWDDLPDFDFDTPEDPADVPSLLTPEPHVTLSAQRSAVKGIKQIHSDPIPQLDHKTPPNRRTMLDSPDRSGLESHNNNDRKTPLLRIPKPDLTTPPNQHTQHHQPVEIQSIEIIQPAPPIYSFPNPALPTFLPQFHIQDQLPIIIVNDLCSPHVHPTSDTRQPITATIRRRKQLFSRLEHDQPIDYKFDPNHRGFYAWQTDILRQQIEQHVQLAAQSFVQTFRHPVYSSFAERFRQYLIEVEDVLENCSSLANVSNHKEAVRLVNHWQEDRSVDSAENRKFMSYMRKEELKSRQMSTHRSAYDSEFHEIFTRTMLSSSVFAYPQLLPHKPFRIDVGSKLHKFRPTEEFLIAIGLEHVVAERFTVLSAYRLRGIESKISKELKSICRAVALKMMPWRTLKENQTCPIYTHVLRRRKPIEEFNPIQYYFKHKRAPPVQHVLVDNSRVACAPIDRPTDDLPFCWAEKSNHLRALRTDDQPSPKENEQNTTFLFKKSPNKVALKSSVKDLSFESLGESCETPKFFINVIYDQNGTSQPSSGYNPNLTTLGAAPSVTPFRHWSDASFSDSSFLRPHDQTADISHYPLLKGQRLITGYFKKLRRKGSPDQSHQSASEPIDILRDTVHRFLAPYRRMQHTFRHRHFYLLNLYNCLITIDIYLNILVRRKMNGIGVAEKRRLEATSLQESHKASAEEDAVAEPDQVEAPDDKKARKTTSTSLAETKAEVDEKDLVFAQNYMERVETAFIANGESYKYAEFENLLKSFDATTEKASDLYVKIESFFLPNHPDLAELFLTFLLPGEAAQIGKFMEHFLLTNMNNFVNKINVYFRNQPEQIDKIMACLKELSDEETITITQIRTRIVPLLKGNPLLVEWFQQCFPSDRIADHPQDTPFESLSFHKATEIGDDPDVFEYIPQSELVPDPVDNPCHIRYINGSIYYGGRILLPAQLSFQVNSGTADEPRTIANEPTAEEAHCSTYKCVHEIKRYGDMKLRMHVDNDNHLIGSTSSSSNADVTSVVVETESTEKPPTSVPIVNSTTVDADQPPVASESASTSIVPTQQQPKHCTDIMLKAHAVRLNPNAHATELIRTSDLMDMLRPNHGGEKNPVETTPRGSPKKQQHPKTPAQTAVRPRTAKKCAPKLSPIATTSDKPPPPDEQSISESAESNHLPDSPPQPEQLKHQWSRDEDKIVLEAIKNGFASEDELVQRLQLNDVLTKRTGDEIRERFTFLMDIILNL